MELKNKYVILLLTNRDSDNIGDQVIENSDIGLLHALMRNLGFSKSEYQISSRSASIITKKYMKQETLYYYKMPRMQYHRQI